MRRFRVEALAQGHAVDGFDCGDAAANRFLARAAYGAQRTGASRTYLGTADATVVGFYTLVVAEARREGAPTDGAARGSTPVLLLTRLAVSRPWQGKGLGTALLRDAVFRALQAADVGGVRAFAVHAKDARARAAFAHYDFAPSPVDPRHLFASVRDLRRLVG